MLLFCYNEDGDNMQCPNCKLNIKDDATICMHCGMVFEHGASNSISQQNTVNPQQPQVNQPTLAQVINNNQLARQQERAKMNEYLDEYSRGKYSKLCSLNFSFGVFFFGIVWLLVYRLYKDALIWIGKSILLVIAGIVLVFISAILGMAGLNIPDVVVEVIIGIAAFVIHISYCTSFSYLYSNRANAKVEKIMYKTQDEEKRIRMSRRAGRPLYIFLVLPFIFPVFVFQAAYSNVYRTINNQRKYSLEDQAVITCEDVRKAYLAGELTAENGSPFQQDQYYYVLIGNRNRELDLTIDDLESYKDVEGYILTKYVNGNHKFYYCFTQKKYNITVYGTLDDGTKQYFKDIKENEHGECNMGDDLPDYISPIKIVQK